MRTALTILISIHGIIHIFGFLKAFGIAEFNAISQPISKAFGIIWLFVFLLLAITAALLIAQSNYWWITGMFGIILSQFLIMNYWGDAKFGTIINLVILVTTIVAYATFKFNNEFKEERIKLLQSTQSIHQDILSNESLLGLPPIVQRWLTNSGVIGKQPISTVHLVQELQLKMKPDQSEWSIGQAEQYFTVHPPGFNWSISTQMNPILGITGRDKFEEGKGDMVIKLLSLIPVANSKSDKKVNQATLQRYLAEIVWFPSASLSQYIQWESIDAHSASATMEYKGCKGSGEFHFDKNGNFVKFVAMRYQDSNAIKPTEWTVIATKSEERNGIKIPVECEVSWKVEDGRWTWLKLKIKDIQYNIQKMPEG